jgi:tRNA threonylcarbamoyladenosine biosynthesis protein TsaB
MNEAVLTQSTKPSETDGFVLGIETATDVLGVAVNKGHATLAEYTLTVPQKHAELLMPAVRRLLADTGLEPGQLTGVALSSGPGSYTGLRIGTSLAKGLCLGLNIPLIDVKTPLGLAEQVASWACQTDSHIAVWLDARRMEVYHTLYSANLEIQTAPEPCILDPEWIDQTFVRGQRYILVGDGVPKALELLKNNRNQLYLAEHIRPSAAAIARAGVRMLKQGHTTALETFEPVYLKPARVVPSTRFDHLRSSVDTSPSSG